jgi:hypothetical protein
VGFKIQEEEHIPKICRLHMALVSDPRVPSVDFGARSVYHKELWMYKYANIHLSVRTKCVTYSSTTEKVKGEVVPVLSEIRNTPWRREGGVEAYSIMLHLGNRWEWSASNTDLFTFGEGATDTH